MSDLIAFLRARLDEEERLADAANSAGMGVDIIPGFSGPPAVQDHIATWSPARARREGETKRAILDEHAPGYPVTYPKPSGQPTCGTCHAGGWDWDPADWPCPTVRILAAAYSDHPDYPLERQP